jgi:hypothetical protein
MERITTLSEQVRAIEPPLSFQCIVKGKVLTARVTGRLDYEVVTGYRIEFSDGYVGDFYVESFGWTEGGKEQKPSAYFFAIRNDLRCFLHFEIYDAWYGFRTKIEGVQTNVFVIYDGERKQYKVYYHADYQFSLMKMPDKWYAGSERKGVKPADPETARNISLLIEAAQ